jgi:hypothetical protein
MSTFSETRTSERQARPDQTKRTDVPVPTGGLSPGGEMLSGWKLWYTGIAANAIVELVGLAIPAVVGVALAHQVDPASGKAAETIRAVAIERGAFANWRGSVWSDRGRHVRNATMTAIAPTGTIGIIANTTPGIEPLFALAYRRVNVLDGQTLADLNPLLLQCLERSGVEASKEHFDHAARCDPEECRP